MLSSRSATHCWSSRLQKVSRLGKIYTREKANFRQCVAPRLAADSVEPFSRPCVTITSQASDEMTPAFFRAGCFSKHRMDWGRSSHRCEAHLWQGTPYVRKVTAGTTRFCLHNRYSRHILQRQNHPRVRHRQAPAVTILWGNPPKTLGKSTAQF